MPLQTPEVQPVLLVDKAHSKQQRPEAEEADDAIALAQLAHIHQENLANGDGEKNQYLPAQKRERLQKPTASWIAPKIMKSAEYVNCA